VRKRKAYAVGGKERGCSSVLCCIAFCHTPLWPFLFSSLIPCVIHTPLPSACYLRLPILYHSIHSEEKERRRRREGVYYLSCLLQSVCAGLEELLWPAYFCVEGRLPGEGGPFCGWPLPHLTPGSLVHSLLLEEATFLEGRGEEGACGLPMPSSLPLCLTSPGPHVRKGGGGGLRLSAYGVDCTYGTYAGNTVRRRRSVPVLKRTHCMT